MHRTYSNGGLCRRAFFSGGRGRNKALGFVCSHRLHRIARFMQIISGSTDIVTRRTHARTRAQRAVVKSKGVDIALARTRTLR